MARMVRMALTMTLIRITRTTHTITRLVIATNIRAIAEVGEAIVPAATPTRSWLFTGLFTWPKQ